MNHIIRLSITGVGEPTDICYMFMYGGCWWLYFLSNTY